MSILNFTMAILPNITLTSDEASTYAMELLKLYVPFEPGDPKFAEVCKDFGGSGTTCGFLCHWLMWRLGIRDPSIVNRAEPSDGLKYHIGMNIAMIFRGGKSPWHKMQAGDVPEPGDVCLVSNGPPTTEHVFVFMSQETDDAGNVFWNTADGGQTAPNGKYTAGKFCRRQLKGTKLGDRTVWGWIPLKELKFETPCIVAGPE